MPNSIEWTLPPAQWDAQGGGPLQGSPLDGKTGVNPQDGRSYGTKMSNRPVILGSQLYDYRWIHDYPRGKPENIWGDFSQWGADNCLAIAVIKLAMMQFGKSPLDVFKSVKETADGFQIVLRNGESTYLSREELKQAAAAAGFKGEDPTTLLYANFLFAVSAKRYLEAGYGTYSQALKVLCSGGSSAEYAFRRLGLWEQVEPVSIHELVNGRMGMFQSGSHIEFAADGHEERWGKKGGTPPTTSIYQAYAFKP
jgi:hypothetical protein